MTDSNTHPLAQTNSQQDIKPPTLVPFTKLFRFATQKDKLLMFLGTFAAIINGFGMPAFSYVFGMMIDQFRPGEDSISQLVHNAGIQSMWFVIIGGISFLLSLTQQACWNISGENQSLQYRRAYFQAVLKQEVGWFDKTNPNELSTKIATQCMSIKGAICDRVAMFVMSVSMFFAGFLVGYIRGWQMSLVVTAALPIIFIGGMVIGITMKKTAETSLKAYAAAGGCTEQCLNAIKTVKSLNGEQYELSSYSAKLTEAFEAIVKNGVVHGFGIGIVFCTIFLAYSLSFWYGGKLIDNSTDNTIYDRSYTAGDVIIVFFSILTGSFQLGNITPCLIDFAKGQEAARHIFEVIDRQPEIYSSPNCKKIPNFKGLIEFHNVSFAYPTKSEIQTLKEISLSVLPHKKTALVGESGCGKSTIMQLIERFYDPLSGRVTIDGVDIKDLDLKWMRDQIGYVGQEPVLFAATIRENLQFGNSYATEEEMIGALKQSNAWEFVNKLEQKLDTYVGNMGNQFSGGQKQRMCIARAILKNPQILLLDEATSALDRQNEREIQETLDYVSSGRTTLVIAHKIQTIQNSDKIYVIEEGKIVEEGSFASLSQKQGGKFQSLSKSQTKEAKGNLENFNVLIQSNSGDKKESIRSLKDAEPQIDNSGAQEEKTEEQKKKDLEQQEKENKEFVKRLFEMNKPERGIFLIGVLVTIFNGTGFPFAGLILAEFITILSTPTEDDFLGQVNRLALYFVILAISVLILYTLQIYLFTRVGEALTLKLRTNVYQKIMHMPCSWFDKVDNTPGNLISRLSTDCQQINILTTSVMAVQFQNLSTLLSGLLMAFIASWQITLVGLGMMPLMMIAGILTAKFQQSFSQQSDKAYKGSGNIVTDAVTNIRTVASFANEQKIMDMFEKTLEDPSSQIRKKGVVQGLMYGFSQFSMFAIYAVVFIASALFVRDEGVKIRNMYISVFCVLFAGFGAGSNNAFIGDAGAAKNAARNIFKIIDSEDEVQQQMRLHNSQQKELKAIGSIEFVNVSFKYPSRDTFVFKNLCFQVKPGQHVAFVGPSGCGKSTIMQIILRFYDDYSGEIMIDGVDIRQYDISSLRSNFGVIFQDPILFDTTFRANIQYNTEVTGIQEIQEASRIANALNFIEGSDAAGNEGFERKVGIKGSQISGGQKQRVAVARAILKKPKIMLLDEATSALDQENERILQEALEKILREKTSITIAHRIHTIKDSDVILVMQEGQIVEKGNYTQLMEKKGLFFNMNNS